VRDAHFTLSQTKCQFAAADLDYLRHHISLGRFQPRHKNVEALLTLTLTLTDIVMSAIISRDMLCTAKAGFLHHKEIYDWLPCFWTIKIISQQQ